MADETGYHVVLIDGPARGYDYETMIAPGRELHFAPVGETWLRVVHVSGDDPWPGQVEYVRASVTMRERLKVKRGGGLVTVRYRYQSEERWC